MNSNRFVTLTFLCFSLLCWTKLSAQLIDARIDSLILTEFGDVNGPGCVFMVATRGKPIYQKALGEANLELDAKMTPKIMVDSFKNEPGDFLHREGFDYNNSGYVLLGYIIVLVSGETYYGLLKLIILTNTNFRNLPRLVYQEPGNKVELMGYLIFGNYNRPLGRLRWVLN